MNDFAPSQGSVLTDTPKSVISKDYPKSYEIDSNERNLAYLNLNKPQGSIHELQQAWSGRISSTRENSVPTTFSQTKNLPNSPRGIVEGFIKTCQRWNLNSEQQKTLLGYSPSDPYDDLVLCVAPIFMTQDFKDRIGYVIGISIGLQILFRGNREAEINWLVCKRKSLGDLAPIVYMLKGHMIDIIEISHLVDRERGF